LRADKDKIITCDIGRIAVCGSAIMQHIFLGVNPVKIGFFPYTPIIKKMTKLKSIELDGYGIMGLCKDAEIMVSPCASGFIGGDVVCGLIASQSHRFSDPSLLLDLGTNGEMVLVFNGGILSASASAGPAFEGYRLDCGMKATVGAIESVAIDDSYNVSYSVIGGIKPRGICGSGIISAISELIKKKILTEKGHILPPFETKRMRKNSFVIAATDETSTGFEILMRDKDVEVIQQAKAAFSSGIACLLHAAGLEHKDLKKVFIAGAFGNGLKEEDLRMIGLIPYDIDSELISIGNAAGFGVSMLLLCEDAERVAIQLSEKMKRVDFSANEDFEDRFIEALFFKRHQ
ncbi:MAG: ASKHA domain-containing protein, partial [Nitrospirae bacterium]|nr:ASKHA domain-containing protein [Nitrospirota bacterium]